jgi:hypothetical protein
MDARTTTEGKMGLPEFDVMRGEGGWYYMLRQPNASLIGPFLDKEEAVWYAEQARI